MDRAKKSIYGNSCKRERVVRSGAREQLRALDLVYRVYAVIVWVCACESESGKCVILQFDWQM